jgi:hypothetical protein
MGFVFAACGDGGETGQGATTSASASSTGQGEGGQGGAVTGDGMTVTKELCGAIAKPFCDALFACCTASLVLEAYGGKAETCEAKVSADCLGDAAAEIEASIAAGHTILDAAQLDQCVKKLEALSEGGAACLEPPRMILLTDCVTAYRGQIAPGDACTWSSDDLSFVHCKDSLCQEGSCVPFVATGAACSANPDANGFCNYTKGEWCLGESSMGMCGPRGDIGAACNHPGSTTYECKSKSCGLDGKCAAPTPEGICESAG